MPLDAGQWQSVVYVAAIALIPLFWLSGLRPVSRAIGSVLYLWYVVIGMARDREVFLRRFLIWCRLLAGAATILIVIALLLRATDS